MIKVPGAKHKDDTAEYILVADGCVLGFAHAYSWDAAVEYFRRHFGSTGNVYLKLFKQEVEK